MDSRSFPQRRQHRASAMDAAAPFVALERRLAFPGFPTRADKVKPTLAPGKEWARIDCSCKKAHGCGNHGEKVLEGITLYVRTDYPYLTTTLSIFLSEEARRSIEAELKVGSYGTVVAEGAVKVATEQEQLLVMFVAFSYPQSSQRMYYLVYDATDASLYMIPFIPDHIVCTYTTTPVPRFTGGRDHELVLLARKFCPTSLVLGGLICVCSPATRANEGSNEFKSKSTGLWQVKPRLFPEVPYAFAPQQMFCFQGKLFWADFAQGLMYCDLRTRDSFVKFDFISLPRGYLVRGLTESPTKRRTIGCIGSTIYFVYIDHGRHSSCPGDEIVKVWTLDMDSHTWKHHRGFPCPWKEIWRQVYFMDAGAGAGARDVDVEPQYPVLMPGGALCLYLHQERKARESDYICSFDMHSKRPLWFGPVRDHHSASFILPANFFVRNYLPPSKRAHKRKLERRSAKECAKTCKPRYPSHSSRLSAREELK